MLVDTYTITSYHNLHTEQIIANSYPETKFTERMHFKNITNYILIQVFRSKYILHSP